MSRTIDATLANGLATGKGDFFVRAYIWNGVSYSEKEVLGFEIDNIQAKVTVPLFSPTPLGWFYIQRGLKIEGVEYPVNSSKFRTTNIAVNNPQTITYHGNIFWDLLVSTPGDVATETVITAILSQSVSGTADYTNTASYGTNSEWWRGIKFYPAGKTVLLNTAKKIEPLLKQKYLAQICDLGANVLKVIGSSQYFEVAPDFALNESDLVKFQWEIKSDTNRKFIWKDQLQTLHTQNEGGPVHNLGYIESTVTPNFDRANSNLTIIQSMPNLAMTNGDAISIDTWYDGDEFGIPILIKEVFDTNKSPSWFYEIRAIEWTSNSEGGALPSTIERVSNYTPINASTFNNNLDSTANNLQALAEAVDDLPIAGGTAEEIQDIVGAMVTGNTETGITVTYQDADGTLDFELDADLTTIGNLSPANDDIIQRKAGAWANRTLAQLATDLTELIQDIVGAMFSGNTETNITVTYQDSDGTIDLEATGGRELLSANRTYYVRTDGSDSNDGLTDSSGGAFLTAGKANAVVATLDKNGYNVTVQFGAGNWNESIIINTGIGDGTVTWQGTLTSQETATSATVSAGSGSTPGTVTKTGQFTGNTYTGYIAYFATDAVYRIIKSNTNDVLTLADITVSSTTQDVTVYAWGTTINKIELPAGTVGVILKFLHLDGTGETYSNYLNPYSSIEAETCRFDLIIYTQQGNWEEMRDCYFYLVASGGMVQFNGGGGVFGRCFVDANHNTGIGIVASRTATLLFCGGTVDGDAGGGNKATYGVRAWGASSIQCNGSTLSDGSTTGSLKVQNCDIGIRADTVASIVGTSGIGYTGNTTNESADGATFGYID